MRKTKRQGVGKPTPTAYEEHAHLAKLRHFIPQILEDKAREAPAGDTTQARRQSKRRKELEAAAQRDGFDTASAAITAWKNGDAILIKKS
jgi:N-acyl-D-aspartate/D-glutamate deacylase